MTLENIFQLGNVRRTRQLINEMGKFGPAGNADTALMLQLITEGVSMDARDGNGWTLLMRAAFFGRAEIIQPLLDRGADIHAIETKTDKNDGATALILCCMKGHTAIAETLLQAGAKVDSVNDYGATALHFAGHFPATVRCLINHGAPLEAANKWGMTPLMSTARDTEEMASLDLLLKAGADFERKDLEGKTALDHAEANTRNASQLMRVPLALALRKKEQALQDAEARRRQDVEDTARTVSVVQKDVAVFKSPVRFRPPTPPKPKAP